MIALHALADPAVMCSAALVAGLGLRHFGAKRLGSWLIFAAGATLYLLSTPLIGQRLMAGLEVGFPPLAAGSPAQADAIVVLSADLRREATEYDGDTVGDLTLERMRYGAAVHRQTGLPILVTGGHIRGSRVAIGRVMAEAYRSDFQIKVRWVEDRARNTFENATLSKRLLDQEGIDRIILVTHAWHMRRSIAAFEHAGFDVIPAGTGFNVPGPGLHPFDLVPRSAVLATSALALHEWVGWVWYQLVYL